MLERGLESRVRARSVILTRPFRTHGRVPPFPVFLRASFSAEPFSYIALERLHSKRDANSKILARGDDGIVAVTRSDVRGNFVYTMRDGDGEDEEETISFVGEYADRHPAAGDADVPTREGISQRRRDARLHAPITTTASKYLFAVTFAGGNAKLREIQAAYPHQLSLRIDEAEGGSVNLDCFEYKPTCADVLNPDSPPIPTRGELNRFANVHYHGDKAGSADEDDTEAADPDDESDEDNKLIHMNYKALAGKFLTSRCFRLRIALSNVRGWRLMAASADDRARGPDSDSDFGAVLVLEIAEPLGETSFATRTVRSKRGKADAFALCQGWLPGDGTASSATRFYFYGNLEELKQTAAMIARTSRGGAPNSLAPGVSVAYGTAPRHKRSGRKDIHNVTRVDPPPTSAWDGSINNLREVFEASLARLEPTKRMMMRMMTDPESALRINQDPDSSPEDMLLSNLFCQHMIANRGTEALTEHAIAAGQNGEECSIM